jgi:hypothetical protein
MAPSVDTMPAIHGVRGKSMSKEQKTRPKLDGAPFVMPSRRGIDPFAPDFDPEAFVDLLGEHMMQIQHEVLREILELQADVEYLRRHGLNGRTDVESFRKCLPVVSYGDIEADIMKLVNGDPKAPVLSADPIAYFHIRSFSSPPSSSSHFKHMSTMPRSSNYEPPDDSYLVGRQCSSGTTNGKPKYILSTERSFVEFDGTSPPFNDTLYRR